MTITQLIVCIVAGLGAGLGTGLAGLSAAAVVSPMLITFLHMPAYQAIGIALASDVLASGVSAWTYKKNKNIDIRHGVIMLISVLIFTLVGSFVSSLVPNGTMGGFSKVMTLFVGLKFIIRPIMTTKEVQANKSEKQKIQQSILCGVVIGFICGFVGAGGGMMLLLVLTSVLGYELKIEDMEFDSIINAIQSGKADIGVAGITVTEDRQQSVDFTDSYASSKQVIIVKE